MLEWIRRRRGDPAAIAFASSPGTTLVDFLLGQLPELEGAEPLLQRVEEFRALPIDEQSRQLPATYLFIERYLINVADLSLDRSELRRKVVASHKSLLDVPGFWLIFEPQDQQEILLCRELLTTLLEHCFEVLGGTGDNLLPAARAWLLEIPARVTVPMPFAPELEPPTSAPEWIRLLTRMTHELFARVEGILGRSAALRLFEAGYSDLASRYLDLPTFSVVIGLLPEQLLDERKIRELNRGQMRQVVLDKVERLQQANEKLEEKNIQLEVAQQALESANEELEDRVRERTEALRVSNAELKQSEEKFRRIAFAAHDAIVMWDDFGRVSFWNRAAERIFGYSKAEILEQEVCKTLIPWRFHAPFRKGLLTFAATGQGLATGETVEWEMQGQNREEFPVELSLSSVEIQGRWHALAVVRDIRERKRSEEERRQLEQQMQHNQRLESLGLLAGGIAHDFNNLLSSILGDAGLVKRRAASGAAWEGHLDKIETAAVRAAELTHQMLAYSGRGQFVVEACDLSAVVEEMAQLLEVSVSKQVNFEVELAPDLPPIEADRAQVQQVVMNLITNASDALGDEVGSILARTGVIDADRPYLAGCELGGELDPGSYLFVEVRDSGCGMDEAAQKRIFEPFFSTKFVGRGLGLAAVLGIVRGHSGAIRVESEAGHGTTFRVLFPAAVSPGPASVAAASPKSRGETKDVGSPRTDRPTVENVSSPTMKRGRTILVVDDESDVREMITSALEVLDFEILTAVDGQQAIDTFRRQGDTIDLVIMDMTMPKMDGKTAFLEMLEIRRSAKVILSSGYSRNHALRDLENEKPIGFLEKPYTLPRLVAEVTTVLEDEGAVEDDPDRGQVGPEEALSR